MKELSTLWLNPAMLMQPQRFSWPWTNSQRPYLLWHAETISLWGEEMNGGTTLSPPSSAQNSGGLMLSPTAASALLCSVTAAKCFHFTPDAIHHSIASLWRLTQNSLQFNWLSHTSGVLSFLLQSLYITGTWKLCLCQRVSHLLWKKEFSATKSYLPATPSMHHSYPQLQGYLLSCWQGVWKAARRSLQNCQDLWVTQLTGRAAFTPKKNGGGTANKRSSGEACQTGGCLAAGAGWRVSVCLCVCVQGCR